MTDTTTSAPLSLAEEIRQTVSGMDGVHRLGTLVSRLATAVLRDADRADGVRVAEAPDAPSGTGSRTATTGAAGAERSVIVEVALVAEYPARIDALCDAVREEVERIVRSHGHVLAGVDVDVVDVHGPFDPPPGEEPGSRAAETADGREADASSTRASEETEPDDTTGRISQAAATAAAAEARAIAEEPGADRDEVDVEIRLDAIAGSDADGDAQAIAEATPARSDDPQTEEHADSARVTVEDDAEAGAAETRDGER